MALPNRAEALVVVSFGGPEGPDDVMPFLRNVTRGRNIPDERLAEVAEHYYHFGGVSPINSQNRALIAALEPRLDIPIYFGNRNWDPFLTDTVRQMAKDEIGHAVAIVTSAYGGYSGRTQYLEDVAAAQAEVGQGAPTIDVLPEFYDRAGFVEPMAEGVRTALADEPDARLVFTAHSVPTAQQGVDTYLEQLRTTCAMVAGDTPWELVYQSRSGPPSVPWLEPDINDHLAALAADTDAVVVLPLGFVSDHVEVIWDLDNEAQDTADRLGMRMTRVPTVGTDPRFVGMIADMVAEVS